MFKPAVSVLLLFLSILVCFAEIERDSSEKRTCGYESCPKTDPNKLNVHLVPHTHSDPGWLKTIDQYYYGSKSYIFKAGVQYIIDDVIQALKRDPTRRFVYVESSFFWKWWQRQNDKTKEEVRSLVNEGRLEIIGGGWCMNDEATTHYQSIIDQTTWGFRRWDDMLGECARPKIGWQIDPFGHSREQASLFAQFGFDGMFFGRLDWQDKNNRLLNKTAELIWKGSSSLGDKADLFTVVLFNGYLAPPGFCFDILCLDDPVIDDPESPENNVEAKIAAFVDYCQEQAKYYNTNNIILTMGEDFSYQNANMWFLNMDKLIRYTKEMYGSAVNVFYSTPSCYLKSLHDAQLSWTTKSDDFFPYSSDPHAFWTGYFTSRPTFKFFERMGNNFLQVAKQLSVSSKLMDSQDLIHFKEAVGVVQHHDAITGTEKQHVDDDYDRRLYDGFMHGANIVSDALSKMLKKDPQAPEIEFKSCLLLNISSCVFSETSGNFVLTLYNPTSQPMSTYVRVPVNGNNYNVKAHTGDEIVTQLLPIPEFVRQIPGRISSATNELVFRAIDIPALGHQSFYITESPNTVGEISPASVSSISNDLYSVSVNELGNVVIKWNNINLHVTQSFHYYEGMEGDNADFEHRASGAYIFRPKESKLLNFRYLGNHRYYTGPVVNELHLTINDFISQIVRVYNLENKIDFEWVVGPIPIDDNVGKEVITKYTSNLDSEKIFYTDSNGRQMMKRVRNYRPTWDVSLEEPIAGNYYPVTTKIYLEDVEQKIRMSILNDRAQGGTSMIDGELEVMLHRRLLHDDGFGVGEALNETAFGYGLVAKGTHSLLANSLEDLATVALAEKSEAIALALRPWYLFSPLVNVSFDQWNNYYSMQGSSLLNEIPKNLQILTLEPWKDNTILLRLEHLFEKNEAGALSQSVTIDLADLFANLGIVSVKETSLGGNQPIEEVNRLQWQSNEVDDQSNDSNPVVESEDGGFEVTLNATEIRTFILYVKY
ncbi:lysosomal alpha-mannosidase-like [Microplitis mediator]|uniref:lysosomal alpha-mannosidase-like n=1 Tax=Microplitis mediator TaxID=375433 RepID=UPI002553EC3B|nr:lysosomal alpha-mannosidase-like [Microplitis mediator]